MRLEFTTSSTIVRLDDLGAVKSDALEGVHGDENNAGVCVYAMLGISISDGVEHLRESLR